MRIIDKSNSINEIVNLVLSKAKYQKVIICIDENSDMNFIDSICKQIDKRVVLMKYYYNKNNVATFLNMLNNGVRVVIYNVSTEHFYTMQSNSNYVLNIFLPQSSFVLPYVTNVESVFGDNLLVCDTSVKDYTTLTFMYEMALTKLWNSLLQDVEVDLTIFKRIDALANSQEEFYSRLLDLTNDLKTKLTDEYRQIDECQLPYYVYLRLCAILKMIESLNHGKEEYIDFYKTELSIKAVEKAYALVVKYDIIDIIKLNSINLIKVCGVILNRLKIIIKKYFNFKNIKLNKLNKIIKNQSKLLNIDNLLYISYIFNTI